MQLTEDDKELIQIALTLYYHRLRQAGADAYVKKDIDLYKKCKKQLTKCQVLRDKLD